VAAFPVVKVGDLVRCRRNRCGPTRQAPGGAVTRRRSAPGIKTGPLSDPVRGWLVGSSPTRSQTNSWSPSVCLPAAPAQNGAPKPRRLAKSTPPRNGVISTLTSASNLFSELGENLDKLRHRAAFPGRTSTPTFSSTLSYKNDRPRLACYSQGRPTTAARSRAAWRARSWARF
jgi:hypothetical protein